MSEAEKQLLKKNGKKKRESERVARKVFEQPSSKIVFMVLVLMNHKREFRKII